MESSTFWHFSLALLLVNIVTVNGGGNVTYFNVTSQLVKPGSQVTFQCTVTPASHSSVFGKEPFDSSGVNYQLYGAEPATCDFSTRQCEAVDLGSEVIPDEIDRQQANKRFNVSISNVTNSSVQYQLTINNLQPGDSGIYRCSASPVVKRIPLHVAVEPTDIVMYLDGEQLNRSDDRYHPIKKVLELKSTHSLKCVTHGSYPQTNISFTSGSTLLGPVDIINGTVNKTGTSFLATYYQETKATINNWVFNPSHIGRPLTCAAGVLELNSVSFTFIPITKDGPPQFHCNDSFQFQKGLSQLPVNCEVYLGQNDSMRSFKIHVHSPSKNITLSPSSTFTENYKLAVSNASYYGLWNMTLTINNPDSLDLNKTSFDFYAQNSYAQTKHVVTIKTGATPPGPGGEAVKPATMSLIGLLTMVLLTITFSS